LQEHGRGVIIYGSSGFVVHKINPIWVL
jgi:hypothetical protein